MSQTPDQTDKGPAQLQANNKKHHVLLVFWLVPTLTRDCAASACACDCCCNNYCCLQAFPGAERIVSDVQSGEVTVRELQQRRIVQDDRIEFTMTDSALLFGSPDRGTAY